MTTRDCTDDTFAAAECVLGWLRERGETLAVAESLTGGLLAAALVAVPGASDVFRGGIVCYAADLKASLVGVPADLLARCGPVDPDVAVALAAGVRDRCAADWGLATTGVAGPLSHGGHPAGRVYVAMAGPGGVAAVRELTLPGDRAQVRALAVTSALGLFSARMVA